MSIFFSTGIATREQRPNFKPRVVAPPPPPLDDERLYQELISQRPALIDDKIKLHAKIIDEFNLAVLERMPREELVNELRVYVAEYVRTEKIPLNQREMQAFVEDLVDEMIGYGPIEPLLKDPTITDILINTHKSCFVERFGKLEETTVHFKDEGHLLRIIHKIVSAVGRRIDESSPTVDARLPDGSRVNVAIRPIAVDGPLVSIRKFSKRPFSMDRLIELGALRSPVAQVLEAAVQGRMSMIISGGTGSGKTTLLNALSCYVPQGERIITIEDAAELQLQLPHVARMETRPANAEGKGELRQRELVKNALRMRPDRIIIGECRGDEAFDMLQAMNTGHEGSMTTVHANTPRDAVKRLEQMVGMAGASMTTASIRSQIASAIRLIVQLQRLPDGSRRVTSVSEVTGMEGEILQMQELYRYVKESTDDRGMIQGSFRSTGIRPVFLSELKHAGVDFPASYFDPTRPL
ncbi:CpaF family protein [Bradyrhizobium jicamae]|uniref:CpaF family protein n=1 Tax=Bradyrhizobium jicamae TaxID=280332 RepID=UPI001BA6E0A7|nr:CpaF family protein [Bradyrhizobium jicamae]MBR0939088.1 CpaF family protein [Bradyrhizobium jicamae]